MKLRLAAAAALACALVYPATLAWRSVTRGYVLTEDLNGDHRPDRWRVYDAAGRLVRVAVDTNFDGTADVEEYYTRGIVVRREIDRNFDGRVDQIDEIDPDTGERIAAVQDVDFDGTADRLILSANGRDVVRQSTDRGVLSRDRTRGASADQMAPLDNPFSRDSAVRSMPRRDAGYHLLSGSKLLIGVRAREGHRIDGVVLATTIDRVSCIDVFALSSRGPPNILFT